ncbi:CLUMA_CG002680, isoform A [Clunio marinus]|uniref:CLUMA_CG002680, isoform A n=1 Tax=Clunio marinus TaxID=568069 RepID=A0A1J1HN76_9DIPT|nr:CLUMA_CG002680, isoform A [Clunio marinus]
MRNKLNISKPESNSSKPLLQLKSKLNLENSDDSSIPEGLVRCEICNRNFLEDRIAKHQLICEKTKVKKRRTYDAAKKRVQGTEAENYVMKPMSKACTPKPVPLPKPSNWRAKHADFIKTIRIAKQIQSYVDKGGKLSDLPPPPPSENPDYIQCPHCSRRFNEAAANRHIPICKNMQHNKPKPKPSITSKSSKSGNAKSSSKSFSKRR